MKSDRKPRAKETGVPVLVRLQAEFVEKIDDFRRAEKDLPGRPEAIRRLLERALESPKRAR